MANFDDLEREAFKAAHDKRWDDMMRAAERLPAKYNIWERLPGAHQLPDHVIHNIVHHLKINQPDNLSNFIFEMSSNLPDNVGRDTLNHLASHALNDSLSTQNITGHPNYAPDEKILKHKKALDFWNSYEKEVNPSHLATIKSLYTGNRETVQHRGAAGSTNQEALPHLKDYAKDIQKQIMDDPYIQKRYINGKPHIKVYRGINGPYSKAIKDKLDIDNSGTVKAKRLSIPTGHMSSWTTDPKQARRLMWMRQNLSGEHDNYGMVISKWKPVENILHSGTHRIVPGANFVHHDESEIIFGHPTGKSTISTSNIELQPKPIYSGGSTHPDNYMESYEPKMRKSEELEKAPEVDPIYSEMSWPHHPTDEGEYEATMMHKPTGTPVHIVTTGDDGRIFYTTHNGRFNGKPTARVQVSHTDPLTGEENNTFTFAHTEPNHRGKGLSSLLHEAAAFKYGHVNSDHRLSPESNALYRKLKQSPNLKVKLGPTKDKAGVLAEDSQHEIEWVGPKAKKLAASEILSEEELAKSWGKRAAAAATALTLLGAPKHADPAMEHFHEVDRPRSVASLAEHTVDAPKIHPGLAPIAYIESSGGKNINHHQIKSGLNSGTSAIGTYGIMPLQVIDTVKHDQSLRQQYPEIMRMDHIKDQNAIRDKILQDKTFKAKVLNSHWNRLRRKFNGNTDRMAYAWLNGISGAMKASDKEVSSHPYVKKYRAYNKMLSLENKPHTAPIKMFKKSESVNGKFSDFKPTSNFNPKAINDINDFLDKNAVHKLDNVGLFSKSAIIVGKNEDNSWLIKFNSKDDTGQQSSREGAFFDAINRAFDVGAYSQTCIEGTIAKSERIGDKASTVPCVAIKMLDHDFVPLSDIEHDSDGGALTAARPLLKNGTIHKLAATLFILGDTDAHGENALFSPLTGQLVMIDHGNSMAGKEFLNHFNENYFMPYILRLGVIKEHDSYKDKVENAPKINDMDVNRNIYAWLHAIDEHLLVSIVDWHGFSGLAAKARLDLLKEMSEAVPAEDAIVAAWARVTSGK